MKIFKYLLIVIGLLFCSLDLFSAKTGWYKVEVPTDAGISKLDFFDEKFGVIITGNNELLITLDGGDNFINRTSNLPKLNGDVFDLKIISKKEIYITFVDNILMSTDSCNSWKDINSIATSKSKLSCRSLVIYDSLCYCETYSNL